MAGVNKMSKDYNATYLISRKRPTSFEGGEPICEAARWE